MVRPTRTADAERHRFWMVGAAGAEIEVDTEPATCG